MTALQTNTAPKFSDLNHSRRPELLSKKELLTTVEMMYEATQDLFSYGSHTALSKMLEDAFTAYVESDAFLSQHPTPHDQAAILEKIFQMRRFLQQMDTIDGRVLRKSKKRFYKGVQEQP